MNAVRGALSHFMHHFVNFFAVELSICLKITKHSKAKIDISEDGI